MKLTIDFETRSEIDLNKCGPQVYFEHPSTSIMCMSVKGGNLSSRLWVHPRLIEIMDASDLYWRSEVTVIDSGIVTQSILDATIIEAHNANFERTGWREIGTKRYGWGHIPFKKWRCSAAKAAVLSLPRSLEEAGATLALPVQKDKEGHKVMLKMCKPRKRLKAEERELEELRVREKEIVELLGSGNLASGDICDYASILKRINELSGTLWHEKPEDLLTLFKYCLKDTDAEHCLSEALPELTDMQLSTWRLNQKVNDRGIPVDTGTTRMIIKMVEEHSVTLDNEIFQLTDGQVGKASQTAVVKKYLQQSIPELKNLQKDTISKLLRKKDLSENAKRVLEIRQERSKASTAKFQAFLNCTGADGTMKDTMMYHGASTGRSTGKRIQPLNMPRGSSVDIDGRIGMIQTEDIDLVSVIDNPMKVFSSAVRNMIRAPIGKDLMCSDFSRIESTILTWLAGDERTLEIIRKGECVYRHAYADTFSIPYNEVTKDQRQIGKVCALSLGYQGGWRAYMNLAGTYGVSPPDSIRIKTVKEMYDFRGKKLALEEAIFQKWAAPMVRNWRLAHPSVCQMWEDTHEAAKGAIRGKHECYANNITWFTSGKFLHCELPSGRLLSYYDPKIITKRREVKSFSELTQTWERKGFRETEAVTYMGRNSYTHKWERKDGYGGLFTENVTQAIANDILVLAEFRLDKAGYGEFMSVYDEVVGVVGKDFGSIEDFEKIMCIRPEWASDLPIEADGGWRGERYRK